MAFESLSERLNQAFKTITGKAKLTESNMDDMLREVRYSLLEADVNINVVTDFVNRIKEQALGQKVLDALNPSQMVLKIVRDQLVDLLGQGAESLQYRPQGITRVMMVGLQGTGKTTAAAKVARYIQQKQGRKPLLVACDLVRPAAIGQLETLGQSIGVPVFQMGQSLPATEVAEKALIYAQEKGYDTLIFDTAGRLHIDESLMGELADMKASVNPDAILLTVDALTGQDIVNVATGFNETLSITGLIVTKTDGDARGGGLLSVRQVTKVPVYFVSNGEKVEDLEVFHPDRMAERILGMGDMLTLIEQAQERMDMDVQKKAAQNLMSGQFTFNDMLKQFEQLEKMGSFQSMLKMVPGMGKLVNQINDDQVNAGMKKSKAIIQSMTPFERSNPDCLKATRKSRIAAGAGVKVLEVNRLIKQLDQMRQMAKMVSGGRLPQMNAMGGFQPVSKHQGSKKNNNKKKKKKKR